MTKQTQLYWINFAGIFIVMVIIGLSLKLQFDNNTDELLSRSFETLASEENTLRELLTTLNTSNGTQSVIRISDCSHEDRVDFDRLLSSLGDLTLPEMQELNEVYNNCAYYFSTIASVSASVLSHEVELYERMLYEIEPFEPEATKKLQDIEVLHEIVALETEKSALQIHMVDIQAMITDALMQGQGALSPEISALRTEAQETNQNIIFLTQSSVNLQKNLHFME